MEHKHFDMKKVLEEHDFKNFLKYEGSLKKIVFIEERGLIDDLIFDHSKLKTLDAMFVVDLNDGTCLPAIENLKKWVDRNQIPTNKIFVNSHSDHEAAIIKQIFGTNSDINLVVMPTTMNTVVQEFLAKKFKKRFIFLNRNWQQERLITFIDLHRRGVTENSYFSFFNSKNVYSNPEHPHEFYTLKEINQTVRENLDRIKTTNNSWAKLLDEYWNDNQKEIVSGMPYLLENESNEIPGRSGQQVISNTLQDAFVNSAISLVSETNNREANNIHFQCTEKTYKSMIYRHPFFVYATQNQLERTRSYGFKTFSHIFDESYDILETPWERIYHINNQVESLNKLSDTEFKKIVFRTVNETAHNYSMLMKKLSNLKENIKYSKFNNEYDDLLMSDPPDHWYNNAY
jgi:hypothetical protein